MRLGDSGHKRRKCDEPCKKDGGRNVEIAKGVHVKTMEEVELRLAEACFSEQYVTEQLGPLWIRKKQVRKHAR